MKNIKRLLSLCLCAALAAGLCLTAAAQNSILPRAAVVIQGENGAGIEIKGNTVWVSDDSLAGFQLIDPVTGEALLSGEELAALRESLLSDEGCDFTGLLEEYRLDLYFVGRLDRINAFQAGAFKGITVCEGSSAQSLIARDGGRFNVLGDLRYGEVYGADTRLHITGTAGTVQPYAGGFVGAKYGVVDFVNGSMNDTGGFRTRIADRDSKRRSHTPELVWNDDGVYGYWQDDAFIPVF